MEKDLKAMGYDISVQTMSKLYRMVAHVHGQIQNIRSDWCGGYCLNFLTFMNRNTGLKPAELYRKLLHHFHNGALRP